MRQVFRLKNHLKKEMLTPKSSSEPWYCHGDWAGGKAALCHEVGSGSISGEAPTNTMKTWGAAALSPWK